METLVADNRSLWEPVEDFQWADEYLDVESVHKTSPDSAEGKLLGPNDTWGHIEDLIIDEFTGEEFFDWLENKANFDVLEPITIDHFPPPDETPICTQVSSPGLPVEVDAATLFLSEQDRSTSPASYASTPPPSPAQEVPTSTRKSKGSTKKKKDGKIVLNPRSKECRKRDQNRDAAIRYRMKKREEVNIIINQREALEQRNMELKKQTESIAAEVKYLKGLLREMFEARRKQ